MKTKTIGIIVLFLILLSPIFVWGIHHLNRRYHRYVVGKNLKALGLAQTVYSNDYDDEYMVQNGQMPEGELIYEDPNSLILIKDVDDVQIHSINADDPNVPPSSDANDLLELWNSF